MQTVNTYNFPCSSIITFFVWNALHNTVRQPHFLSFMPLRTMWISTRCHRTPSTITHSHSSLNVCSSRPPTVCPNVNGRTVNSVDCQCGSADCTSTTGMYCAALRSKCYATALINFSRGFEFLDVWWHQRAGHTGRAILRPCHVVCHHLRLHGMHLFLLCKCHGEI